MCTAQCKGKIWGPLFKFMKSFETVTGLLWARGAMWPHKSHAHGDTAAHHYWRSGGAVPPPWSSPELLQNLYVGLHWWYSFLSGTSPRGPSVDLCLGPKTLKGGRAWYKLLDASFCVPACLAKSEYFLWLWPGTLAPTWGEVVSDGSERAQIMGKSQNAEFFFFPYAAFLSLIRTKGINCEVPKMPMFLEFRIPVYVPSGKTYIFTEPTSLTK